MSFDEYCARLRLITKSSKPASQHKIQSLVECVRNLINFTNFIKLSVIYINSITLILLHALIYKYPYFSHAFQHNEESVWRNRIYSENHISEIESSKGTQNYSIVLHENQHTTLFRIFNCVEMVRIENHCHMLEITCYIAIIRVFNRFCH